MTQSAKFLLKYREGTHVNKIHGVNSGERKRKRKPREDIERRNSLNIVIIITLSSIEPYLYKDC